MNYNHQKIEKKWQKEWEKSKLYQTPDKKKGAKNFYTLVEFPYPSGNLHTGHWYAFSVPDIFVRAKRMQGRNVLFPIGFDAFGLPAENAAIQRKLNPYQWTISNISYMRKQLRSMGASFDWSREVVTCDPAYYRWTQWIFLQFFKRGLAYQAETQVNWCPKDKTVLANEQVAAGTCERCGTVIEQRTMKQWMLKITDYADKLLNGLEKLNWPEEIKEAQRNWIGKSEGAEVDFPIARGGISKIVLMHGKDADPSQKWYPWFIQEAKQQGIKVVAPALPKADDPVCSEWVAELSKTEPDENTVLVGHSRGGVTILRWLETLTPNRRVKKVILIGTNSGHSNIPKNGFFSKEGYNFNKIKSHCDNFVVFHSKDDSYVPFEYGVENAKGLNARFFAPDNRGHFGKLTPAIPELISEIFPSIKVFTTRPDTLFGATYMVLAPEHHLVESLKSRIKNWREISEYIKKSKSKTELERQQEKEKTGVELKGIKAINPATKEEIPIFIADYVLAHYGTGAIMAVPAHDERDFEFAKKHSLPIQQVVRLDISDENSRRGRAPSPAGIMNLHQRGEAGIRNFQVTYRGDGAYTGDGILINSGKFDGMKSEDAKRAIAEFVGGKMTVQYKLRDWVLSRQRYWGTPIPLVYCVRCGDNIKNPRLPTGGQEKLKPQNDGEKQNPGWFAVTEKELPVKLPEIKDYLPTGDGKSPLAKATKWAKTKCPKCKADAERETDTMDTFVDSSWYFLRYCDPNNKTKFADFKKMKRWMPVDRYSGGAEHTTMHLLYSRFWIKAMHDLGFVEWDEPYAMRMNRGIILGTDGQKMSKSKGNVVDPDEYVQKLGSDTVRMYLAFIGPYSEVGSYPWNPHGILGIRRFLDRVFALSKTISYAESASEPARRGFTMARRREDEQSNQTSSGLRREVDERVLRILHKTIKKVTEDIEQFRFNTAISQLMILLNEMEKVCAEKISNKNSLTPPFELVQNGETKNLVRPRLEFLFENLLVFLKLLAPFAPHLSEELYQQLRGHTQTSTRNNAESQRKSASSIRISAFQSIHQEPWPTYDPKLVEDDTFELVIQINGKVRDKVSAPIAISQKEAEHLTFSREKVKNILGSHQPRKVIFIPKRLINIVL